MTRGPAARHPLQDDSHRAAGTCLLTILPHFPLPVLRGRSLLPLATQPRMALLGHLGKPMSTAPATGAPLPPALEGPAYRSSVPSSTLGSTRSRVFREVPAHSESAGPWRLQSALRLHRCLPASCQRPRAPGLPLGQLLPANSNDPFLQMAGPWAQRPLLWGPGSHRPAGWAPKKEAGQGK